MDGLFLSIYSLLSNYSFVLYGVISLMGGLYVYVCLPETMLMPLSEVQKKFSALNGEMRRGCPTITFFRRKRRHTRKQLGGTDISSERIEVQLEECYDESSAILSPE